MSLESTLAALEKKMDRMDRRFDEVYKALARLEGDSEEEDRLLTVKEVAEMLQVCDATVYRWAKYEDFPKQKKFGRASRWSKREMNEYQRTRKIGAYGEAS